MWHRAKKGQNMNDITSVVTARLTVVKRNNTEAETDAYIIANRETEKEELAKVLKEILNCDDVTVLQIQDFVQECKK